MGLAGCCEYLCFRGSLAVFVTQQQLDEFEMQNPSAFKLKSGSKLGISSAAIAAIGASICCIGPLLLALGIGGAWVGSLAAFDAYRPTFSVITLGFLGFAFYCIYRKPKAEECVPGSYCEHPKSNSFNKISLWIVTVFAIGLLSFPYVAPGLAHGGQSAATEVSAEKVTLAVQNMTCGGCALTVQKSLAALDGVINAEATFEPPHAMVTYDPNKVHIEDLINATTNTGYPSEIQNEEGEMRHEKN